MALSKYMKSFEPRFSKEETEWSMKEREVKEWRTFVTRELSPGQALIQLKQFLTSNKVSVGSRTFSSGMTLVLYQACTSNVYSMVEYLIDKYVTYFNINHPIMVSHDPVRPFPGTTVSDRLAVIRTTFCHAAVMGNSVSILKLLIKHKASLNIPNCCSKVPIMLAIDQRDVETVSFLLNQGVDVNCKDASGLTPLMYATRVPSMSCIIPHLVRLGANITATDNRGYTALHIAIAEGTIEAVKALIKVGALEADCYTSVQHPTLLFDHQNFKMHDFRDKKRITALFELLSGISSSFDSSTQVDLLLMHATFYFFSHIYSQMADLKFFQHKMAEALMLKHELGIKPKVNSKEIESYDEFKTKFSSCGGNSAEIIKEFLSQTLSIRRRCLGQGNSSIFTAMSIASKWMIQNEEYSYGLTLMEQTSEMLVSVSKEPQYSGESNALQQMALHFLSSIKKLLLGKCSKKAQSLSLSVTEVDLIDVSLLSLHLNPMLSKTIELVCSCVQQSKQAHAHTTARVSSSLLVVELLGLLDQLLKKDIHVNMLELVSQLVEKCPSVLIDINGCPTTLLHLSLSSTQGIGISNLILENGGHYMINAVGPCGDRPAQIVYNDLLIKCLLEYGVHLDSVNSLGRSVMQHIKTFAPHLLPDSSVQMLSCMCALVIAKSFSYHSMDIPTRVKNFILLHDRYAEKFFMQQEINFTE